MIKRVGKLRRNASSLIVSLLILSFFAFAFTIQPAKAATGTIIINPDGSISSPVPANITTTDNVTYTFTDNNYLPITVSRSNITINGNGHTLQGNGAGTGINLSLRSNVTIKNMGIKSFSTGVGIGSSSNISVLGNSITNNTVALALLRSLNSTVARNNITTNANGIYLYQSSLNRISENKVTNGMQGPGIDLETQSNDNSILENGITENAYGVTLYMDCQRNTILKNDIENNGEGVYLYYAVVNSISGNNIHNNTYGIALTYSTGNSISNNNVTANNHYGIELFTSLNNAVYHNNFIGNTLQVYVSHSGYFNSWDDGYPSGGNYWSDYLTRYPTATEIDNSGIWNTPYVINSNNTDRYPLMKPYSPLEFSVSISPSSATLDVGQSKLFTSSVTLGTAPYYYQWYLNGLAVLGAENPTWTFAPTSTGTYNIYLNVSDSIGSKAKSNVAQVTVTTAPPVGGVSVSVNDRSLFGSWLCAVLLSASTVLMKGFIAKKRRR
jgi:parallel beta-helix repeat protein